MIPSWIIGMRVDYTRRMMLSKIPFFMPWRRNTLHFMYRGREYYSVV